MTASQAKNAMTAAMLAEGGYDGFMLNRDPAFTASVIAEAMDCLRTMEPPCLGSKDRKARRQFHEKLKAAVVGRIDAKMVAGVIIVSFLFSFVWQLVVAICIAIIVRWLLEDSEKRELVQQARGN